MIRDIEYDHLYDLIKIMSTDNSSKEAHPRLVSTQPSSYLKGISEPNVDQPMNYPLDP